MIAPGSAAGVEQREILRIELNGARRQIPEAQWQEMVDHLRAQVDAGGVRRFSDRTIAKAVGVERTKVQRHESRTENADGAPAPIPRSITTEDGKVRQTGGEWTATSRALHLIRQFDGGSDGIVRGLRAEVVEGFFDDVDMVGEETEPGALNW